MSAGIRKRLRRLLLRMIHLGNIVNPITMQPEHVGLIGSLDEMNDILSNVVGQFAEQCRRLGFCQGPHAALEGSI